MPLIHDQSDPSSAAAIARRLAALEATGLLDTPAEPAFDRVTALVAQLLKVEVSLVSLVDASRQFFKSVHGLPEPLASERGTPLSHSICQHVVAAGTPLRVDDTRVHPLVRDNPSVTEHGVTAYLGAPIRTPAGAVVGSLCAIAGTPRSWTDEDLELLESLAAVVESEIALRESLRVAETLANRNETLAREAQHRVKNALAVAASLVQLSLREAKSAAEVVDIAQGRIRALAKAQDAAFGNSDTVPMRQLVELILAPFLGGSVPLTFEGPPLSLNAQQISPMALILHELATNAVKHGAIGSQGAIDIAWAIEDDSISFLWDEKLQGAPINSSNPAGFGGQLIKLSVMQLGGTHERERHPDGLRLTLRFPKTQ